MADWNQINSFNTELERQEAQLTLRKQHGHCRNIEEPQILGSFSNPRPRPLLPLGLISWWALANRSCMPNLKSLASSVTEA